MGADILSKRRSRSVARPRQVAMALAKELTNHSLPELGNAFGGRDHTTVLHACRKIEQLREESHDIKEDYKNLKKRKKEKKKEKEEIKKREKKEGIKKKGERKRKR